MSPHGTISLPAEVVAECLRYVEFRDVLAASHVSRLWRTSALAVSGLWSHIYIDTMLWKSPDLLHTAVARAGRHAVDLEFVPPGPVTEGMADAIAEHMHRLTSLKWTYSLKVLDTTRPAPLLRELSCEEVQFRVPTGFLGGSPGDLITLLLGETIFPRLCPALSTVTHLRATLPEYYEGDPGFQHIFSLCPRLETLHLHELADRPVVRTPSQRAPRTLRNVVLQSFTRCNLVEMYAEWGLHTVQNVRICVPVDAAADRNTAPFLGDAEELSVAFVGKYWNDAEARIVAQLPGGRTRTLVCNELTNVRYLMPCIADMLRTPNVSTLAVPLTVLVPAAQRRRWPRLTHLNVHIHETPAGPSGAGAADARPRFDIASLECLSALATLETLELYFHAANPANLAAALNDARELKSLRVSLPREVHVHGFPVDVVLELFSVLPRVIFH